MRNSLISDRDRYIGGQIRAACELRGLSCDTVGRDIGISQQQIYKYIRAENRIAVSRLIDIAVRLKLPLAYFIGPVEGLPQ